MLQLTKVVSLAESSRLGDGLDELADAIRSSEMWVRGRQYPVIAAAINESILSHPPVQRAMERTLGFTYEDARVVGAAVDRTIGARYERAREDLGRAATAGEGATADEVAAGQAAFIALFVHPRQLHTVAAEEIAALSGVGADRVALITDHVSVSAKRLGYRTTEDLIGAFVKGSNAMAGVTTVRRLADEYLVLAGAVLEDEIRRSIEPSLRDDRKAWEPYEHRRAAVTGTRAADLVTRLLGLEAPTHTNLMYMVPKKGISADAVAADVEASSLHERCDSTEADCLIVVDSVAICIEVKAGALSAGARRGSPTALRTGLKRTVIEATRQAERLRSLIETNGGLWSRDLEWLDLCEVTEVHLMVVCLDDLAPLGVSVDAMARAGLLPEDQRPWIVSLHDLAVVAEVIRQPAQFLAWLRRRTKVETARWVVAVDELDLLMWFVQGRFYLEPDPIGLRARYPAAGLARPAELRRYRRQTRTTIATLTDDLDSWMYRRQGAQDPFRRPQRTETPWVEAFITFMYRERMPGWLRIGADLVGLSRAGQKSVTRGIEAILGRTAGDGLAHSATQGILTPWGYAVLVFGNWRGGSGASLDRLKPYLVAKKHQLRADRVLGVVLDQEGQPVRGFSSYGRWREDPELDALVAALGLMSPDRAPTALPAAARRRGRRRGR